MKKNSTIATVIITVVVTVILTTMFYTTLPGKFLYSIVMSMVGGADISKIVAVESLLDSNYMGEYDKDKMSDMAVKGFVAGVGDKYTTYMNNEEYKAMQQTMDGGYTGIGIAISVQDGKIYVTDVTPGGPAHEAGMQSGDYILSVDGDNYSAENISDAINRIKSTPKGTDVKIGVERDGKLIDLQMTIREIVIKYVNWEMLSDDIGYIRVETFGNTIVPDFEKALNELEAGGAKGIVIDLRDNPGGSLSTVVEMCDLLLGEGEILTVRYKDGREEVHTSDKECTDIPICVLVNNGSASSSEVMSGALKDHGRATLVGEKTYGKGVVQGIYDLNDNTAIKITVAKYFTPSGECIDGIGIEPDVKVELPQDVEITEYNAHIAGDIQLERAIEVLKSEK